MQRSGLAAPTSTRCSEWLVGLLVQSQLGSVTVYLLWARTWSDMLLYTMLEYDAALVCQRYIL